MLLLAGATAAAVLLGDPGERPVGAGAVSAFPPARSAAWVPPAAAEPAPAARAEDDGPSIGRLRTQESALAELDRQRMVPAAASRSASGRLSLAPPATGSITGVFGERRRGHRHEGIDFDGESGDPVRAAADGTVVHAGPAPSGYSGYGKTVLIDHGDGMTTLYAHLSRITVGEGTVVTSGQLIGAIGTTGSVTGSHLHFELRQDGTPVDPTGWLVGG